MDYKFPILWTCKWSNCELGKNHTNPTDSCFSFREPTPPGSMMMGRGESVWERDSKIEHYLR